MDAVTLYDAIGRTYSATRRPDPRLAAAIHAALGDAVDVVDIGAGAGSYEPLTTVVAVEPSRTMLAQRPAGSAPAVQAVAEHLPLRDGAVDAAMAVLTVHHWSDLAAGVAEMRRVARRRLVFFTWDPAVTADFWLLREYLPDVGSVDRSRAVPIERLAQVVGGDVEVLAVPIPHDCTDGFGAAFWRRPEAYLDPAVQAGMSMIARADPATVRPGLERLAADVASGRWHERHADLLGQQSADVGYRIVKSG